jgi:signal transduction histidine kinase
MVDQLAATSTEAILRDLAHDLRGPLGGLESIAFVLERQVEAGSPLIRDHCQQIRRLVAQAAWLLDDATRFLDAHALPRHAVCINSVLEDVARQASENLRCQLQLQLSPALPPASLPRIRAEFAFHHLLSFITGVAACASAPLAVTRQETASLAIEWHAEIPGWKTGELLRWLDPGERSGGLRRFTESIGGLFCAEDSGGLLRVLFRFPMFE